MQALLGEALPAPREKQRELDPVGLSRAGREFAGDRVEDRPELAVVDADEITRPAWARPASAQRRANTVKSLTSMVTIRRSPLAAMDSSCSWCAVELALLVGGSHVVAMVAERAATRRGECARRGTASRSVWRPFTHRHADGDERILLSSCAIGRLFSDMAASISSANRS